MREIEIDAPGHDLAQLADELFAAFPGWRRAAGPGLYETDVRISSEGETVSLLVPDETDEAAVREVVAAHTPEARPPAPSTADVIVALASMNLEGVSTVAGLKAQIAPIRDAAAAIVGAEGQS